MGIFVAILAPVSAQLIRTSDWDQNSGVRLPFGLSEKTQRKTNPKSEVAQWDQSYADEQRKQISPCFSTNSGETQKTDDIPETKYTVGDIGTDLTSTIWDYLKLSLLHVLALQVKT